MKNTLLSTVVVVGLGIIISGCDKAKGPVVAKVGSQTVTLVDMQQRLADAPPTYQHYITTPNGRKEFLNLIVREKVVLNEAKKSGLDKEETYKKEVARFEANVKRQLTEYKENLLVESYLRKLRSKELAVTDADVQKFFDEHRGDYDRPVELQAAHILVEKRDEAEALLARLKIGEAFEKLARENSKDPASAAQGGKLQPFRRGTLVPDFENAAFTLKKDQTSGVVQTQFGFHIIKLLASRTLSPIPLSEAKETIRRTMERSKFEEWVAAQQLKTGVQINEATAALISAQSAPTQEPMK